MVLSPKQVSAVLVTKGDVDLTPIINALPFDDVIVWNNLSRPQDSKVYGRYRAIQEAKHGVIYTQDDDCVVDAAAIIAQFESGKVVCNMPRNKMEEYIRMKLPSLGLVGWGSCFERNAIKVFERYLKRYPIDELFLRECDRVFTWLNSPKWVDVKFEHLPHAFKDRMGNESRHLIDLGEIVRRLNRV